MVALSTTKYTLQDLLQMFNKDPNIVSGAVPTLNVLAQRHGFLQAMPFLPTNMAFQHRCDVITSLPSAQFVTLGQNASPSKMSKDSFMEYTSKLATARSVDYAIAQANGAQRMEELTTYHIEVLNQKAAKAFIYGNRNLPAPTTITNPRDEVIGPTCFDGLATRLNTLTASANSVYKDRVVSASGTGSSLTSAYAMVLGQDTVHGLYPRDIPNSAVGITHEVDIILGNNNSDGSKTKVIQDDWGWHIGLAVVNPYAVGRLANIDVAKLTSDAADQPDLILGLTRLVGRVTGPYVQGNKIIAVSPELLRHLEFQIAKKTAGSALFQVADVLGKKDVLMFKGFAIIECDAIEQNETQVT